MHFSTTLAFVAAAATSVSAQAGTTIKVAVGETGLTYSPSDIKAPVGTAVEFSFYPKNHTVTQSSFADPCHPLAAGGFFSSFVPTAASPGTTTFTIVVNDTKPIWIYCGQGAHCQGGMVASINAPATGNTLAAFVEKAKNATGSTSPPGGVALGGVLKVNGAASGSGSSSIITATKSVTTTVASGGSSYTTTYGTTYTTGAQAATTVSSSVSTTSSGPAKSTNTGAASRLRVGSGLAGAVFVAALAAL